MERRTPQFGGSFLDLLFRRPKVALRHTRDVRLRCAVSECVNNKGKKTEILAVEEVQRIIRKSQ